jgi:hypothetical protein
VKKYKAPMYSQPMPMPMMMRGGRGGYFGGMRGRGMPLRGMGGYKPHFK